MQKSLIRKGLVIGIITLFVVLILLSSISANIGRFHKASFEDDFTDIHGYISPNNMVENGGDIVWEATLNFTELGGKFAYVVFGEAPDANDGQPADEYDRPLPPSPPGSHICAWFDDGLPGPYTRLWADYRKYSDTSKTWDLYVMWTPSDSTSPTDVTITWSTSDVISSEYASVVLYDYDNSISVAEMTSDSTYVYNSPALATHHFQIIATNNPPYTPSDPDPENGSTDVSIYADLSWVGEDPDTGDTVTYDVYFGTSSPLPKEISNQSATSYNPGTMMDNMQYYWKIVAWDIHGAFTEGPIWSFTTIGIPPEISDVTLTTSDPLDTDIGWENFTSIVTDNVAVDKVKLVLTGDTTTEYPMIKNGDNYHCNVTISAVGRYIYHIWANDTNRNYNTSAYQPFNLSLNEDVNEDGSVGFVDIMSVAGTWGATGLNGWIREDVNNDGSVGFVDIMSVAGKWGAGMVRFISWT